MKYLTRFLLLMAGFALTTAGLMMWRSANFSFEGVWLLSLSPHPLHVLVLGLAMIPPALWEIFILENQHHSD
ncbi:MAG: hypothetical protein R3E82_07390 [Pseudomonadales bacterium]|nr:hypothetical protein [Pseudomonadales bacterium]